MPRFRALLRSVGIVAGSLGAGNRESRGAAYRLERLLPGNDLVQAFPGGTLDNIPSLPFGVCSATDGEMRAVNDSARFARGIGLRHDLKFPLH